MVLLLACFVKFVIVSIDHILPTQFELKIYFSSLYILVKTTVHSCSNLHKHTHILFNSPPLYFRSGFIEEGHNEKSSTKAEHKGARIQETLRSLLQKAALLLPLLKNVNLLE